MLRQKRKRFDTAAERVRYRIGLAEGRAECLVILLKVRFGELPTGLQETILGIRNIAKLKRLLPLAWACATREEFERVLAKRMKKSK